VIKFVTIGVYGFSEETFFQALQTAGVDTFCDIRQRRGVRGSAYAFANSQRLQARLAESGIRYLHHIQVAPTTAVRQRQHQVDKVEKTAKRQRSGLSPTFIEAYQQEILNNWSAQTLLDALPADAQVVALFCVEREPEACHRSLVATRLQQELGVSISHILP
jgi:uncharacterized protein (DUF488 family)